MHCCIVICSSAEALFPGRAVERGGQFFAGKIVASRPPGLPAERAGGEVERNRDLGL